MTNVCKMLHWEFGISEFSPGMVAALCRNNIEPQVWMSKCALVWHCGNSYNKSHDKSTLDMADVGKPAVSQLMVE